MKIRVIMDSGVEYEINSEYDVQQFVESFYNVNDLPMGGVVRVLKNSFKYLDNEKKILFNPTHVSSIEILD